MAQLNQGILGVFYFQANSYHPLSITFTPLDCLPTNLVCICHLLVALPFLLKGPSRSNLSYMGIQHLYIYYINYIYIIYIIYITSHFNDMKRFKISGCALPPVMFTKFSTSIRWDVLAFACLASASRFARLACTI